MQIQIYIIVAVIRLSLKPGPGPTSAGQRISNIAQHSSEKTTQLWRAVGVIASNLNGPRAESQTFRTVSDVFNHYINRPSLHVFLT